MTTQAASRTPRGVRVDELQFDRGNPRHPEIAMDADEDPLERLVATADVDELVQAIGNSGWLDYEPLVVDADSLTVLEGNRRLAALQIIRSEGLQQRFGISLPIPLHPDAIPEIVQAIVVESRAEARDYIGFKHVNGPHKWDSLAKAKFAWDWINTDDSVSLSLIAKRLGDGHNTVARLVNGYVVLLQAVSHGFDMSARTKATFSFSHLYTALPRPHVRAYLGITSPPNDLLPNNPVEQHKLDNLLTFMRLLYGQGDQKTVIQSQNPNLNELVEVLGNQTATAMLLADSDLRTAYQQVEDRSRRFAERIFALHKASRAAAEAIGDYYYDADLQSMMENIQKTVRNIAASMAAEKDSVAEPPAQT